LAGSLFSLSLFSLLSLSLLSSLSTFLKMFEEGREIELQIFQTLASELPTLQLKYLIKPSV
jgi:hypothetical protein